MQATTYIVNTAHGEGQCLPLMEYMSAGKPAIAPIHSAMADYISEKNAFVVRSSVERTHWPCDPRYAQRTMRYRIHWESLYKAYLESYQVALNDPARYARMSGCAVESLKNYCSQAIVREKLKIVFRECGMPKEGLFFATLMKMRHMTSSLLRLLTIRLKMRRSESKKINPIRTLYSGLFSKKNSSNSRQDNPAEHQQVNVLPVSSAPQAFDSTLIDATLSGWFKNDSGELIEGFQILPEDVVLDAGCGDTPFLYFCARQGAEVIFADIDPQSVSAMLKRLEGSPARAVKGLVSDACSLPLSDASVSKIIAMEIMEHVDDADALMKELVRVGKPGAQYLITVPDPVAETLQKKLARPNYFEKPHHIRVIGREEFERHVVNAGLVVEQRKYIGFHWSMWWIFFWACQQEPFPPWHPLLESWTQTWKLLLETPDGPKVKRVLDDFMPKSQVIIARKPIAKLNQ